MSGNHGRFVCPEHHEAFANKGRYVQHLGEVEHHDPHLRPMGDHAPNAPRAKHPAHPAPHADEDAHGATMPPAAAGGLRILGHKRRRE